jgi:hypothetical protein
MWMKNVSLEGTTSRNRFGPRAYRRRMEKNMTMVIGELESGNVTRLEMVGR